MIRKRIPEALLPALEGEAEEDLGKVFGEELPSGLVAAARRDRRQHHQRSFAAVLR